MTELPRWNLDDLYPGRSSKELAQDLTSSGDRAKAFEARYHGKLESLDGDAMAAAITEFEAIDEMLSRIMSFAQLLYATAVTDGETAKFYQTTQERITDISTRLLFFTLEINHLDDGYFEGAFKSESLSRYRPWIRDVRAFRDHQLSEDLEKILHEKSVAGRSAWVRLFDETNARLRFAIGGKDLTSAEAFHLMSSKDGALRREAGEAIGKILGENAQLLALITNTLAKDKEIEDRWRSFPAPPSSRNLSNFVEDEVVDALAGAVKAAYPKLSHRYYRLKAEWLGVETLKYWDRNAPLPDDEDTEITWDEAKGRVLKSYAAFAPELSTIAERFFAERWIDAGVRPGKEPGAFSHPTVPGAHPYILMNYQGKTRDVMTLAHELGHGIHQVLAAPQGHLLSDTPLTLAETASVFGEMLTFRTLVDAETDPVRRRVLLASKIEDMLNTVVRQIAFYDFELRVHNERRSGELTVERLGEIWLEIQAESLGPAIELGGDYGYFWSYIPHFIHSPFYVYAYAFGDCLVNSLYATYEAWQGGTEEGDGAAFRGKYLDMLRAGGTLRHKELLAPFGLDATETAFWDRGLGMIAGFIDEIENSA